MDLCPKMQKTHQKKVKFAAEFQGYSSVCLHGKKNAV